MDVLHPGLGPSAHLLLLAIADFIGCRTIEAKAAGPDRFDATLALQGLIEEGQNSFLVERFGSVTSENLAFIINRTRELAHLAANLHVQLVQKPAIVPKPAYAGFRPMSDGGSKLRSNSMPLDADGLVADVDPTLEQ